MLRCTFCPFLLQDSDKGHLGSFDSLLQDSGQGLSTSTLKTSCHVFMVDPEISSHRTHKEKAKRYACWKHSPWSVQDTDFSFKI